MSDTEQTLREVSPVRGAGGERPSATVTEELWGRFWHNVDKSGRCWLWTGNMNWSGYGVIRVGKRKKAIASRLSYELHVGPIPAGLFVCHHCDVRSCVKPDHLFIGSNADNMADMVRKGRVGPRQGETNGHARLTENDVRAIRLAYAVGGITQQQLGDKYGVNQRAISEIVRGNRWPHVA